VVAVTGSAVRACVLYPDVLAINGDRGNLLALQRRCEWRGIGFQLTPVGLGEPLGGPHDLVYLGGGQDVDQRRCAEDLLATKADDLRATVADGGVVLGVCGGFQLLGHRVQVGGEAVTGLGLVDAVTTRGQARLTGDTVVEVDGSGGPQVLAGYESHWGRTTLGPGVEALGRVLSGPGNDGRDGREGVRCGTVVGTYLRGPVLPANPWLADELLGAALGGVVLEPLDDALEDRVRREFRYRGSPPVAAGS
jgi:CobQ-like glutamine amidotransferase family enzyme